MRPRYALVLVVVLAAGCRGPSQHPTAASPVPDRALGRAPAAVNPGGRAGGPGSTTSVPATVASGERPLTSLPSSETSKCQGFQESSRADDPVGDAGPNAPATGDLVGVAVADDGIRGRFVVTMGAPLPPNLGQGETIGVGVDLAGSGDRDGHQLFVQGDERGWLAYLYAPGGFVKYPGEFTIDGPRLVLTVPWSALGSDTKDGSVTSDWSRPVLAVNQGGSDSIDRVAPLRSC